MTLSGPGTTTLIPIIALVYLPGFTRVAYSGVLGVRSHDYVEAMRSLGAGSGRIMLRTILPNIGGPLLVQFSLTVASGIVLESGLSLSAWASCRRHLMGPDDRRSPPDHESGTLAPSLALHRAHLDHPRRQRGLRRLA